MMLCVYWLICIVKVVLVGCWKCISMLFFVIGLILNVMDMVYLFNVVWILVMSDMVFGLLLCIYKVFVLIGMMNLLELVILL